MAMKHPRERGRGGLSLAGRINLIVSLALAAGMGLAAFAFAAGMVNARRSLSADALAREADIFHASISNLMLVGEAPVAVKFFRDAAALDERFRVGLYRRDGQGAFSDNDTIETVNKTLAREAFQPRLSSALPVSPPEWPYFDGASGMPPETVLFRLGEGGKTWDRIYRPLLNLPNCAQCHGADHAVRGVIDLRMDVSGLLRSQALTVAGTVLGFLVLVSALSAVIGRFMRRVVVDPVAAIARVCSAVTSGDFSGRVDAVGDDEVGRLGGTVNQMAAGLYERFQLTKYVSAGTISSIAGTQEPARVHRTLLFTDVRGFTSYTETHGAEAIVGVLNRLLDEQARVIGSWGGDIDKFVGDEVVAVFAGDGAAPRSLRAAWEIQKSVERIAGNLGGLRVGCGVATGPVVMGMIGSHLRADYTVIGDPVNVAARLCAMAKRDQILVCDCTYGELSSAGLAELSRPEASLAAGLGKASLPAPGSDRFGFSGPYSARLKGKKDAQRVYILTGVPDSPKGGEP